MLMLYSTLFLSLIALFDHVDLDVHLCCVTETLSGEIELNKDIEIPKALGRKIGVLLGAD